MSFLNSRKAGFLNLSALDISSQNDVLCCGGLSYTSQARLVLLHLQGTDLEDKGQKLDPGSTPLRTQSCGLDDVLAFEGRVGPPKREPAQNLKAELGFHVAFMFYECWEHAGCLLIIKAGFMTSLKENKKGKDPSAYSSRPGMKA